MKPYPGRPNRIVVLSDPDFRPEECPMQFRLTYEGTLLGATQRNPRADHKHEVRLAFHPQLKRLWTTHPWLSELRLYKYPDYATALSGDRLKEPAWAHHKTYPEVLASHHQAHYRNWLPLVNEGMGLTCGLDILFLRPGARGDIINRGDVDGRLSTLFDALSVPRSSSGLGDPESDMPFHVLLSDDRLISHVAVETDELLEPISPDYDLNDARVVITVTIKPTRANYLTLGFGSL